jgi:regulator of sigma E protease
VVTGIVKGSPAEGKLKPGDIVLAASVGTAADAKANPNVLELQDLISDAGERRQTVAMTVLRDGQTVIVPGLTPNVKLDNEKRSRGLNIRLDVDLSRAELAGSIGGTPASAAEIPGGAKLLTVDGQKVSTFHDVFRLLAAAKPGQVKVEYSTPASETKTKELTLTPEQQAAVAANRYTLSLPFPELKATRHTDSLLTAAGWGMTETRDFILQFYVTLRRMVGGDVDPSNLMGPVGIFHAGSQFAYRGNDWLLWFLAMISANLAVVNFLPIPIVDGGLFTFLILEKIKGRPVSARTQSIAQVVGLVLLLGVFLFVTYNDITRLF